MKSGIKYLSLIQYEAIIWISGLILLPLVFSFSGSFSVCPFHNLGLDFCPGCGLGASIVYLYRLDFSNSLASHPLGIPALIIILHRIFTLFKYSHNLLLERNSNG